MLLFFRILLFKIFFLTVSAFAGESTFQKSYFSDDYKILPLESLGFLERDDSYYITPVFKNLDMIYSKDFMSLAPSFQSDAKKTENNLSKIFQIRPYFQKNTLIFRSSRRQVPEGFALAYPLPSLFIYPSLSVSYMDEWSIFYWTQDMMIHEMTHIYQTSQNASRSQLVRWFLGSLTYRNQFLPTFMSEGSAVLNESLYGFGGRLFSAWSRAFVFSQIKQGYPLKRLLKAYDDPFSILEKYLHGAYFFAYLHSQYGLKKTQSFFYESGRFFPVGFFVTHPLKRTFGKGLEALFEEYKAHYATLADKQNILPEKALLSSKVSLPINSDKKQIYFLISDMKSPPKLVVINKKSGRVKVRKTNLPLGKVFYRKGRYYSAGWGRTNSTSVEFSLFKEGFKPLKKYNSQYIMDIYKKKTLSLDTRQTHTRNALLLNGVFYDNTHSSAVMDKKGSVYYFKQDKENRILYRDKKALFRFHSYSAYPVEADEEGVYFIASVPSGSSLFVYREGQGVSRLSLGDRIAYARKMSKDVFLVSEIHPTRHEYKIITTKEISEEPFLYTYSFNKKYLFQRETSEDQANLESLNTQQEENQEEDFEEILDEKEYLNDASASFKGKEEFMVDEEEFMVDEEEFMVDEEELLTEGALSLSDSSENKDQESDQEIKYSKVNPLFQDKSLIKENTVFESKAYNPISHLKLYQILLLAYPNIRFLYNFQVPQSLQFNKFISNFNFLSLFQFVDPMHFNGLDLVGFANSQHKLLSLHYSYTKYRPSLTFSFNYEKGHLYKRHVNNLKTTEFLEEKESPEISEILKKKSFIPYRDRSLGFSFKYPLLLKNYSGLSVSSQVQFGQRQFNNKLKYKYIPFLYELKSWKHYIRQEGGLYYTYNRKYPYAYLPYSEGGFTAIYDMLYIPHRKIYINGLLQAYMAREISRELFLRVGGVLKRELWTLSSQSSSITTEENVIFDYHSFHRKFRNLNKLDFQLLKVFNHSYYPLRMPFSLRRWAPLAGFSLLSTKSENKVYNHFFVPFFGVEAEISALFEKDHIKVGFSGESVFNISNFSFESLFEWSFWLKGFF